ncbi:MAG: hypothetical protein NVSMB39_6910 [Candidatus Saccharimonadales bacterium]
MTVTTSTSADEPGEATISIFEVGTVPSIGPSTGVNVEFAPATICMQAVDVEQFTGDTAVSIPWYAAVPWRK